MSQCMSISVAGRWSSKLSNARSLSLDLVKNMSENGTPRSPVGQIVGAMVPSGLGMGRVSHRTEYYVVPLYSGIFSFGGRDFDKMYL